VERVVVAQTPIDAVAIGMMEGMPEKRTMYLSADGVLSIEFLQDFSPEQVRVAMNRDDWVSGWLRRCGKGCLRCGR
jgi:hypothetical protein